MHVPEMVAVSALRMLRQVMTVSLKHGDEDQSHPHFSGMHVERNPMTTKREISYR